MGTGWHSTCRTCGEQFNVLAGIGMRGTGRLFCDACGDTLETEGFADFDAGRGKRCQCGGLFRDDASPRCPKCGSTDQIRDGMILWD